MALDLYTADIDSVNFSDIEGFLGMNSPIELRPTEGVLLDFKVSDSGDWVDSVTAFANTGGGILLLGVDGDKTTNNAPIAVPGIVVAGGDIKARLTSTLVSRVIPRPEFDLAVIQLPSDPSRVVAIVRVREGQYPPYSFSKSGNRSRFPIRVEDTSRDATLRDLETLFQKRTTFGESTESRIQSFFTTPLFPRYQEDYQRAQKPEDGPKPFHTWSIRPRAALRIRLDRAFHDLATQLVKKHYPDSGLGYFWPPSMSGGSHLIRWQSSISPTSGPPARWARLFEFTASGDLRYSERLDRRESDSGESVSDAFTGGRRFLGLAEEFYRSRNTFGSMSILHEFRLPPKFRFLLTFPDEQEQWLPTDAITFGPVQRVDDGELRISNSTTEVDRLTPERRVELVCEFMLAHLRCLRQANIDFEKLLSLVANCPIDKPLIFFP
jgi:hypothetical protein